LPIICECDVLEKHLERIPKILTNRFLLFIANDSLTNPVIEKLFFIKILKYKKFLFLLFLPGFLTITRLKKSCSNQIQIYNTRSQTRIEEESQQGKNLSMEVDKVKEKMDEMSEAQARMEQMVKSLNDTLHLL